MTVALFLVTAAAAATATDEAAVCSAPARSQRVLAWLISLIFLETKPASPSSLASLSSCVTLLPSRSVVLT